ncbi:CG2291 [Drosophila busckii]|uniref:CG2291 n=2 Tax=Drosophila busckii TaxID=30019 RepID=A0A0M4EII0_DROBS|nr:CG2291 [Drosophila busckii]
MNYRKHQRRENVSEMQNIEKTPKFLWADFRRRMIYGTYDI